MPSPAILTCVPAGSRVSFVGTTASLAEEPTEEQLAAEGTLVAVVDVVEVYLGKANGWDQFPQAGMPSVVRAPNGEPGLIVPNEDPPADLRVALLKAGAGDVVEEGDSVIVQYTGMVWGNDTPFDSSWSGTPERPPAPALLDLDDVVPGFAQALIGQKVGSQVLAVIPPDLGYRGRRAAEHPVGLDPHLRDRHPQDRGLATSTPRIPVEERLFSLVLALLATDNGLTKAEILSTVQGYRQRYSHTGDNSNLERQFERDKDDIRELGVPLETLESPGQAGNNQNLRYRIPKGSYDLPADVRFSREETALLGLAAVVWQEGSISGESRRALVKLRSLGVTVGEPVLTYLPRVRMRDEAFEPLSAAIDKHQEVRFDYLKPFEESASERIVQPLALFSHEGRWHLYSLDPEHGWNKTFLLRRIVNDVTTTGEDLRPAGRATRPRSGSPRSKRSGTSASSSSQVEPGSDAEATARRSAAARPAARTARSSSTPPTSTSSPTSSRASDRR